MANILFLNLLQIEMQLLNYQFELV